MVATRKLQSNVEVPKSKKLHLLYIDKFPSNTYKFIPLKDGKGKTIDFSILLFIFVIVAFALVFDFSNGFHDVANVVAAIITTRPLSPRKALLMAAFCAFIGSLLFGMAVAKTIGKNIIVYAAFDTSTYQVLSALIIVPLLGAITWNLITWYLGIPSSSSHALIGGMVGAVLLGFGPDKIIWKGFIYVLASLTLKRNPVVIGWGMVKVDGRGRSNGAFEAKLWRLKGVIRLGEKLKIGN